MLLPDTIIRIVATGGGVIIDLKKQMFIPDTLVRIAAVASASGARVTIKNIDSLLPNALVRIAAAGRGSVVFEL
jgi:DNA replication protein